MLKTLVEHDDLFFSWEEEEETKKTIENLVNNCTNVVKLEDLVNKSDDDDGNDTWWD